ncbi:MAG: hypothetical protein JNK63_05095 [Chthonomonas sp.]|nr:hypothetical protein [Chthonomonas sp.]
MGIISLQAVGLWFHWTLMMGRSRIELAPGAHFLVPTQSTPQLLCLAILLGVGCGIATWKLGDGMSLAAILLFSSLAMPRTFVLCLALPTLILGLFALWVGSTVDHKSRGTMLTATLSALVTILNYVLSDLVYAGAVGSAS